jgi:hypothetical protein
VFSELHILFSRFWRATMTSQATINSLATESYNYWLSVGLTPAQACGLLASEQGESSFDARAVGDHDQAFGVFQHHTNRVLAILKGCGIDIRTASHIDQLQATHWELTEGAEKGVWTTLKTAKTPSDAARIIVICFERPANKASAIAKRSLYAEHWATFFGEIKQ